MKVFVNICLDQNPPEGEEFKILEVISDEDEIFDIINCGWEKNEVIFINEKDFIINNVFINKNSEMMALDVFLIGTYL